MPLATAPDTALTPVAQKLSLVWQLSPIALPLRNFMAVFALDSAFLLCSSVTSSWPDAVWSLTNPATLPCAFSIDCKLVKQRNTRQTYPRIPDPIQPAVVTMPLPTAVPPDSIPRAAFDEVLKLTVSLYKHSNSFDQISVHVVFMKCNLSKFLFTEYLLVECCEAHQNGFKMTYSIIGSITKV